MKMQANAILEHKRAIDRAWTDFDTVVLLYLAHAN